ncbi:MAG: polyprenyl synthetase family protein [Oscillospiraceae bacterium]|nr:polyprenyl synthetase family protein [Oscillospiraceae bacterium]
MTTEQTLTQYKTLIDKELDRCLTFPPCRQQRLTEAMRYSVIAGGKRIRAIITLEFAKLCGGTTEAALPAACAIELLHAFSLIHDDLPCMDDDDLRRGKPSCHIAFDEGTALLAGDALAIYPFKLISDSTNHGVTPENALKMSALLAENAGHLGMTGGQQIDTQFDALTPDDLLQMYELKTSRLIQTAAAFGCLSANADDKAVKTAEEYGKSLGLAFQIVDDILDMTGDSSEIGKPTGSDAKNSKKTYPLLVGVEQARKTAEHFTNQALTLLDRFHGSDFLKQLTIKLLDRNK